MASNEIEARYRLLFEGSPICQWEEDFSEVKYYLDRIKKGGVSDLSKYLDSKPEEVKRLAQMVKIIDVNNKTLKTYAARDKEELLGKLDTVFGEETYPTFKDEILALIRGEKTFESEAINYKLTGEKLYALIKVAVIPGYEKDLSRVIVSTIDITEQKITENALKESESKYRLLFGAIPVGIGIASFEGEMLDYNDTMLHIMRYSTEELKNVNARQFYVNPQDRTQIMTELKESGKIRNKEVAVRRGDGTVFPCFMNMDKFKLGEEEVVFSAFIDNTEIYNYRLHLEELVKERTENLKLANEELHNTINELKKKKDELEEFISTLSHDLKTPLLSIDGFAYLIHEKLKEHLNDEIVDYFERIRKNTDHMNQIVEDILEYSRIGRVSEIREYYSLSTIINEVINGFLPLLNSSNIQVSVEKFLPIVHVERKRIIQVFENLIGNSIKYMGNSKKKKEIEIGVKKKTSQFVTIFVKDTGTGIKEEYIPKLFQLFTRIPNSISKEVSGSGIGLANVKKIIEHHNGSIWVESEEEIGSTFYLDIPLVPIADSKNQILNN